MTRFGPTHADLGPWDLLYSCICFYPFPSFTQRLFEPTKPKTVRLPTHLAVSCLLSSLGRKNSPQKTLLKTPPPPHQCQKTPQHRLATDRLAASFLADHFRNHPTSRASTARFPHQAGHFPFPHGLVREIWIRERWVLRGRAEPPPARNPQVGGEGWSWCRREEGEEVSRQDGQGGGLRLLRRRRPPLRPLQVALRPPPPHRPPSAPREERGKAHPPPRRQQQPGLHATM
ncbi:hypothetical protein BDA96_06G183400 [Sorghum bicolor]|uniref:Uncharacterized protein n=1 Tax=Sorghum bicolor TaxID=4558 RepID=A0A921QU84_SORBI|nr:hypothetical protein BDA96_06G183400 [Sorghum bicolor]